MYVFYQRADRKFYILLAKGNNSPEGTINSREISFDLIKNEGSSWLECLHNNISAPCIKWRMALSEVKVINSSQELPLKWNNVFQ